MNTGPSSPAPGSAPGAQDAQKTRRGLVYALAAYCLWGFLPIYFLALAPSGAFEIVAWRVLFSLVFCAIVIAVLRAWHPLAVILRRPKTVLILGLAGALIYINWQTYVYGVMAGEVVEAALGYFINPIVTILLGVIVLHERLRVTQWVAVGISAVAVAVLAVAHGSLPWIALVLAFSFGLYGFVKKQVGKDVDAVSGLTLETAWLAPVAAIQLIVVGATTGITFGTVSAWQTVAMLGAGVVTAVPLLLFAGAARRLPLVYIGFIQYLTPFIQFLVGVFLLREEMPAERWFGFGLVWLALLILSVDMIVALRRERRRRAAVPEGDASGGDASDDGASEGAASEGGASVDPLPE